MERKKGRKVNLKPILHSFIDIDPDEQIIVDTYLNPKYGLTSATELNRKLTQLGHEFDDAIINKVLTRLNPYTQNKSYHKPKDFSSYMSSKPFNTLQGDLVFLNEFSDENDGYKYLFNVIDTFSRYAFSYYLKDKSSKEVIRALHLLFEDIHDIGMKNRMSYDVMLFICDKGTEFMNSEVKSFFKQRNIKIINPVSIYKAALVERFNRTLKLRMIRYTTLTQSRRYIDVLPDLLFNYNNSYHSTIKTTPTQAITDNTESMKPDYPESRDKELNIGDFVQLVNDKLIFSKEHHEERYHNEVFIITNKFKHQDITKYNLTDLLNTPVKSNYYQEQLVKINPENLMNMFNIEEIIKQQGEYSLVKFTGYNSKFNTWLHNSQLDPYLLNTQAEQRNRNGKVKRKSGKQEN